MTKIFILAGGRGSRMKMNTNVPKTFLSLTRNETIISRQMRQFKAAGISLDDIMIVVSDRTLPTFLKRGPKVDYATVTGKSMGDVLMKMHYLFSAEDTLLLHGDVIMADDTIDEILSEEFTDMMFIGDEARTEIFGIRFRESGLAKLVGLPSWVNEKPSDQCMIFDIQIHLDEKYFAPKGFISDVDYPNEYKWIVRYMKVHKL